MFLLFCCFQCPRSGGGTAPAKLHTLTLGDKEQVIPDLFEVLIEEGEEAEPAVLVRPDEGRQIPSHRGGGGEAPGVDEFETLLREVHQDMPPLVGRDLKVPRQVPRRKHGALKVFGVGPFVSLDPGQVLRVVDELRGRRRVEAILGYSDTFRSVEPNEGYWRAPQV